MKYKTIIFILIIIFLSSSVSGATIKKDLPSNIDATEIRESIEETGKYCYDQAVARDQETKVFIQEKLDDIYDDINYRLTFFKFVNSIVTFIVVFLAIFINSWLTFRRNRKIKDIEKVNLVKDKDLSKKGPVKPVILKEKAKNEDIINKDKVAENPFNFVFKEK